MSLDVDLMEGDDCKFSANITHNLAPMAEAAGIYIACWRPGEIGITHAKQLIEPLLSGITRMQEDPKKFEAFNAPNGWGLYKNSLPWLIRYLQACLDFPEARIEVSR